jgi:hypothetical protein
MPASSPINSVLSFSVTTLSGVADRSASQRPLVDNYRSNRVIVIIVPGRSRIGNAVASAFNTVSSPLAVPIFMAPAFIHSKGNRRNTDVVALRGNISDFCVSV